MEEEARNRFRLSLLRAKEGAEGHPRPNKEEEVEGLKIEKGKEKPDKLVEGEVIEKGYKAAEKRKQEDLGGKRNEMKTFKTNKERTTNEEEEEEKKEAEGRPRPNKEDEVEGLKVEKGKEKAENLSEGEVT